MWCLLSKRQSRRRRVWQTTCVYSLFVQLGWRNTVCVHTSVSSMDLSHFSGKWAHVYLSQIIGESATDSTKAEEYSKEISFKIVAEFVIANTPH